MKAFLSNIKILLFVLAFFSCSAVKHNPKYITPSSNYHIVKKNETVYSISKQHNISVQKLTSYNQIKNNRIFIGQKLYFTPQVSTKNEYVSKRSIPESGYHVVKKGETLYRLSKMYDLEVIDLLDYNELTSFEIFVDQKIYLKPTHKKQKISKQTDDYDIYTVKNGDHLTKIAKNYGMAINELKEVNNLTSNKIFKNQKLKVKPKKTEIKPKEEYKTYIVKRGDYLEKIAKNHNMSLSRLKKINNLRKNTVYKGQKLKVKATSYSPKIKYTTYRVKRGDHLTKIAKKFSMTVSEIKKLNKLRKSTLYKGQKLKVYALNKKTKNNTNFVKKYKVNKNTFNPLQNGTITSRFGNRNGRMHKGIDIGANPGEPIHAALAGKAVFVGQQRGYGNVVILEHDDYVMTVYAHNESNLVRIGEAVEKGQPIATVGATGKADGPHLHFEYRIKGKAINPEKVVKF